MVKKYKFFFETCLIKEVIKPVFTLTESKVITIGIKLSETRVALLSGLLPVTGLWWCHVPCPLSKAGFTSLCRALGFLLVN